MIENRLKFTTINTIVWIVFSFVYFVWFLPLFKAESMQWNILGLYLIIDGMWGLIAKMVLFRMPFVSKIESKNAYLVAFNTIVCLIGLSLMTYGTILIIQQR